MKSQGGRKIASGLGKSANARIAENNGERWWTEWTLEHLIKEVLKHNKKKVSEKTYET